MKLNKEIESCISKTSQRTADDVVKVLKANNLLKTGPNFYKSVEILLYNYTKLKLAVEQKEEEIEYIQNCGLPGRSKSIVFYSTHGAQSSVDRTLDVIESYKFQKAETERDIKRIDTALDKISEDKYYKIIDLKYFQGLTEEEIAEELEKDLSTIYRNKKRLINSLKIILFPESIREYM